MNIKLNQIQYWPELALEVKWSAATLAKKCGVSGRTLERYFLEQMGRSPKAWLLEQRLKLAVKLLCDGNSVKETAHRTGYQHASTFSREYKKLCGSSPSKHLPVFKELLVVNVA